MSSPQRLSQMSPGSRGQVSFICGKELSHRLLMLGIRKGTELALLRGPNIRGAVVQVGRARLALGRDVIENISVTPLLSVQEAAR